MDTGSLQMLSATTQGVSTVGNFVNAQRQAGALVAQSDFDAKLAAVQATDAIQRGSEAANRTRVAVAGEVGTARARLAASGVQLGSGSAAGIEAQTKTFGALDEQMIRNNAAREAMGFTTQATLDQLGARQRANAIRDQSYATLLTGATATARMFPKSRFTNTVTPSNSDSGGDGMDSV